MAINFRNICFTFLIASIISNKIQAQNNPKIDLFTDNLFKITEVMVTDVASPPSAARFYAYPTLAAHLTWEIIENGDSGNSLLSSINHTLEFEQFDTNGIDPHFASVYAMLEVAKKLMPSGYLLTSAIHDLQKEAIKNKWIRKKNIQKNKSLALTIANKVLTLAREDNYSRLSTLNRYIPKKGEGYWYPTPPAYMAAIEPEWKTIKTFFLSDLKPYKPVPPAEFSLDPDSDFYKQLKEVYDVTSKLTETQKLIADFWDCNPFMVQYSGHMAIGIKKISPGGHWIGITGIAAQKANLNWSQSMYIHALLAMSIHDAFVSCWEEKYDSDRTRPESAINKHMDNSWRPILQTPPFPEYTSGHSVISTTSAVILTAYFGDNFGFLDTSEVYFGLPERFFNSFNEAALEATISRLYGGIHFRDAIEEGARQGTAIGNSIQKMIPTKSALIDKK